MVAGSIKVTNLCDNTVYSRNLIGEHGLALLLEARGKKILFDTGAGLTLIHNAQTLGVSLKDLDAVVLSHGHFDHTGGLAPLVEKINPIPVYAHPDIFGAKFSKKEIEYRSIGVPWSRQGLEQKGVQFFLGRSPVELTPGITLTGEIPRLDHSNNSGETLFLKNELGMVKDPLLDDQAMIVEGPEGLIILLGCAHAGLINTLRYILQLTGEKKVFALLGGTHLLGLRALELNESIEQLLEFGLQKIAPCHCTGLPARFALYQAFSDRFLEHQAGSVFFL